MLPTGGDDIRALDEDMRRIGVGQPRILNHGWPSWGWKARRQATHSVAPHTKASTMMLTARTWPQRILVPFMTTDDQEPIRGHGKSKLRDAGLRDSVAKEWDGARAAAGPSAARNDFFMKLPAFVLPAAA